MDIWKPKHEKANDDEVAKNIKHGDWVQWK